MLRYCNRLSMNALTFKLSQPIVIRYQRLRSAFDKTSYNPEWVPRVAPYSKHRKPRMSVWSDQNIIVPHQITPLRTIKKPKMYLKQVVEKEQKQKAARSKQYILQDIRSGDIVDLTYQQTFQSDQTTTHRCFVLSFKRRNSLTASLQVLVRLGGMNIKAIYLVHSPKVTGIKLISKGSGDFRANLKTKWMTMPKTQVTKPLIRNRVMKLREGQKRRVKKSRSGAIQYDLIKSDNIKTIL